MKKIIEAIKMFLLIYVFHFQIGAWAEPSLELYKSTDSEQLYVKLKQHEFDKLQCQKALSAHNLSTRCFTALRFAKKWQIYDQDQLKRQSLLLKQRCLKVWDYLSFAEIKKYWTIRFDLGPICLEHIKKRYKDHLYKQGVLVP